MCSALACSWGPGLTADIPKHLVRSRHRLGAEANHPVVFVTEHRNGYRRDAGPRCCSAGSRQTPTLPGDEAGKVTSDLGTKAIHGARGAKPDRKSTRLNSSHVR